MESPMDFAYEDTDPWRGVGRSSPWREAGAATAARHGTSAPSLPEEMELDLACHDEVCTALAGEKEDRQEAEEKSPSPGPAAIERHATKPLDVVRAPAQESLQQACSPALYDRKEGKIDSPSTSLPHPLLRKDTPYILSGYLNLFFSASILSSILYVILKTLLTLASDISTRRREYNLVQSALRQDCQRHYLANGCHLEERMPALEGVCREWQVCLEGLDDRVGKARVAAEIIAEVVNSFIEPISFKAFSFFLILLFGSMAMTNMTYVAIKRGGEGHDIRHGDDGSNARLLS